MKFEGLLTTDVAPSGDQIRMASLQLNQIEENLALIHSSVVTYTKAIDNGTCEETCVLLNRIIF